MKEILITSSVLIAALLLLRQVFRKTISRRAQYALWALVLLRLLVPFNLPALEHNVLTAAEPVTRNMESLYLAPNRVDIMSPTGTPVIATDSPQVVVGPATPDNTLTFSQRDVHNTPVENSTEYQRQIPLKDLFRPVWYAGIAVMAAWFLLSNLRFWGKLRRSRTPYAAEGCPRRVYLVESGLSSPCLFGLFRPAIYLTPAAVSSPEALRHVLAHEETHVRHLDPLWSLLRAVCLAVYWFDPLVWAAAAASKNDCELACDEGAISRLGEAERIPYGKTLLSLIQSPAVRHHHDGGQETAERPGGPHRPEPPHHGHCPLCRHRPDGCGMRRHLHRGGRPPAVKGRGQRRPQGRRAPHRRRTAVLQPGVLQ